MNTHAVGDNIKHLCKRKGLTLQILADRIGVSDPTMSNWVNGHKQITAYGLLRVSRILGVSMEELMEGIEDEKYLPKEVPDVTGDAISRQSVIDMLDETKRIARQSIDGAVLMTFERVFDSLVNITNALPTIQPEPHWIPCSEGLPKEEGFYLVTLEDKCGAETTIRFFRIENGERQWSLWGNENITAWMPKPEPYKGVTE